MNSAIDSAVKQVSRRHMAMMIALVLSGSVHADLLSNGNLDLDVDANSKPDGWTSWAWSNDPGGWSTFADYKVDAANDPWDFNGTPYVNAGLWGAWDTGGAGWFQENTGTAGQAYSFSAFSGSEAWSTGAGELRLIFLNESGGTISQEVQHTVFYVAGKPWAPYTVSAIAPAGTAKVKTEFATWGARGTVMWDDATLVQASIWNLPVGGDYLTATHWTNGTPNGIDASAQFNSATASDEIISIEDAVTLGSLGFKNSFTYQLAGPGSLKMQSSGGNALIVAGQGTQRINVPLTIASNTAISANDNTWLRVSKPVTVNAGMKLTQYGVGSVSYESTLTLQQDAWMNFRNSMHPTTLTLGSNAIATVEPRGSGALKVLTINGASFASGAKLDVNDNALVVDYDVTTQLGAVRSALQSGFADGAWTGSGIVSSFAANVAANPGSTYRTGLGYGEASNLPGSATGDLGLADSAAVVVRYTAMGDADFNGIVESVDFVALTGSFGKTSDAVWSDGDFDYNGKVNTLDFNILAGSFGANLNPPAAGLGGVVPEPATTGLSALGGLVLIRRRRG